MILIKVCFTTTLMERAAIFGRAQKFPREGCPARIWHPTASGRPGLNRALMSAFLHRGDLLYPSTQRMSSSYSFIRREQPGVLAGFNYCKQIDVGDKEFQRQAKRKIQARFMRWRSRAGDRHLWRNPQRSTASYAECKLLQFRCRYSNSSGQSEMEELGFRCLDAICRRCDVLIHLLWFSLCLMYLCCWIPDALKTLRSIHVHDATSVTALCSVTR